jgi:hypothetical protein
MEDFFVLQTLEQVKAFADPLRQRILKAFCQAPTTTKQVAQQLGEKPTKLYHHVTTLEQVGLIQIVETRQNRGTVEKYYQAVARKFHIDRNLFAVSPELETAVSGIQGLIIDALDETLTQIQDERTQNHLKAPKARDSLVFVRAQNLHFTSDQITNLRGKIETWLEECCNTESNSDDQPTYALTLLLYPTFDPEKQSISASPASKETG